MDVAAYLKRINYHGPLDPTAETLRALHLAHLLAVPFENLDIHLGRPIALDEARFFDKIVARRRGGFCYELNGLFGALLRELGFDVTLLSARVAAGDGNFGPEFDHLVLLVQLEARWLAPQFSTGISNETAGLAPQFSIGISNETAGLADVGFGDSFREPLRLDEAGEQRQALGAYRLFRDGAAWTMREMDGGGRIVGGYRFTLQPRRLADFAGMCHYHQTSPESHFTRKRICSLATLEGRITLSDNQLIVTANGERREQELSGPDEYAAALREYFGIELDG
jgi:N-hydroxyarylamine O-acetyltransferase